MSLGVVFRSRRPWEGVFDTAKDLAHEAPPDDGCLLEAYIEQLGERQDRTER